MGLPMHSGNRLRNEATTIYRDHSRFFQRSRMKTKTMVGYYENMTFLEEFDGYYNVFEWELSEKMQIY
jgi:hypothetical protein